MKKIMTKINRGKDFEKSIKKSFEKIPDTSVYRLQDSMGGYAGVANICDFIVYHYPHQYFIECKSIYGYSFPLSNITDTQYRGLVEMSKIKGVVAGVIIWFIDYDLTIFVTAEQLLKLKQNNIKSINLKRNYRLDSVLKDTYIFKGKKRRVFFDYDMADFFEVVV